MLNKSRVTGANKFEGREEGKAINVNNKYIRLQGTHAQHYRAQLLDVELYAKVSDKFLSWFYTHGFIEI